MYRQPWKELGSIFEELTMQNESEAVEGIPKVDHVHMLISIPRKYSVAQVVGFIKGKSAIQIARMLGRQRNFIGQNFWPRGYCVSTTGMDEVTIQKYIRSQEKADTELDQLRMFEWLPPSCGSRFSSALSSLQYQASDFAEGYD